MSDAELCVLAAAALAAIGLLLIGTYALGVRHANDLWLRKSSVRGGLRKECGGELYYVANCADPEGCALLRDRIEGEQERRANAQYAERIRNGWR